MQLKHNLSLNCNLDPSILSILIMKQIYQSFVGKFCNIMNSPVAQFVEHSELNRRILLRGQLDNQSVVVAKTIGLSLRKTYTW